MHAHLVFYRNGLKTWRIGIEQEQGEVVAFACAGREKYEIGNGAVGDPHFRAVDHPMVAHVGGCGLNAAHVRSGPWLCHTKCSNLFALKCWFEVIVLLFFGANGVDHRQWQVSVRVERHAQSATIGPAQFFSNHDRTPKVEARTAIFCWKTHPEKSGLAHFSEHVLFAVAGLFPLVNIRDELFLKELTERFAQQVVLFGKRVGGHGLFSVETDSNFLSRAKVPKARSL